MNGILDRCIGIFNTVITPRNNSNKSSHLRPLYIMWTRINGSLSLPLHGTCIPNHFVPLLDNFPARTKGSPIDLTVDLGLLNSQNVNNINADVSMDDCRDSSHSCPSPSPTSASSSETKCNISTKQTGMWLVFFVCVQLLVYLSLLGTIRSTVKASRGFLGKTMHNTLIFYHVQLQKKWRIRLHVGRES